MPCRSATACAPAAGALAGDVPASMAGMSLRHRHHAAASLDRAEFWVQMNPPTYADLARRHKAGVEPVEA